MSVVAVLHDKTATCLAAGNLPPGIPEREVEDEVRKQRLRQPPDSSSAA